MPSSLDPVSQTLYYLGFFGGFPLLPVRDDPTDYDWDDCSMFKTNKLRLIWCYSSNVLCFVVISAFYSYCFLTDLQLSQFFDFSSNTSFWSKYNIKLFDVGITYALQIALFGSTLVCIHLLNQSCRNLSDLGHSVSRISGTTITDEELNKIASTSRWFLAKCFSISLLLVPALSITTLLIILPEDINLGRRVAAAISYAAYFFFFSFSLPFASAFLVSVQCIRTTTAMMRNYRTQLLTDKPSPAWTAVESTRSGPPTKAKPIGSNLISTSMDLLLDYGNHLANIVKQLNHALGAMMFLEIGNGFLLGISEAFLSTYITAVFKGLDIKQMPVFLQSVAHLLLALMVIAKLRLFARIASELEDESDETWNQLRHIAVVKFESLSEKQLYEVSALQDRLQHIATKGAITPLGYFHLNKPILIAAFTTIITYLLILNEFWFSFYK